MVTVNGELLPRGLRAPGGRAGPAAGGGAGGCAEGARPAPPAGGPATGPASHPQHNSSRGKNTKGVKNFFSFFFFFPKRSGKRSVRNRNSTVHRRAGPACGFAGTAGSLPARGGRPGAARAHVLLLRRQLRRDAHTHLVEPPVAAAIALDPVHLVTKSGETGFRGGSSAGRAGGRRGAGRGRGRVFRKGRGQERRERSRGEERRTQSGAERARRGPAGGHRAGTGAALRGGASPRPGRTDLVSLRLQAAPRRADGVLVLRVLPLRGGRVRGQRVGVGRAGRRESVRVWGAAQADPLPPGRPQRARRAPALAGEAVPLGAALQLPLEAAPLPLHAAAVALGREPSAEPRLPPQKPAGPRVLTGLWEKMRQARPPPTRAPREPAGTLLSPKGGRVAAGAAVSGDSPTPAEFPTPRATGQRARDGAGRSPCPHGHPSRPLGSPCPPTSCLVRSEKLSRSYTVTHRASVNSEGSSQKAFPRDGISSPRVSYRRYCFQLPSRPRGEAGDARGLAGRRGPAGRPHSPSRHRVCRGSCGPSAGRGWAWRAASGKAPGSQEA